MEMAFIDAAQGIFSIITLILLGYWLAEKGWFTPESSRLLSVLVTRISLPGFMLWSLTSNFDKEKLIDMSYGMVVPMLLVLGSWGIGALLVRLIKLPRKQQGIFITGCFGFNTIFLGLPVNQALFGSASLPYVLLFYIANTLSFWTLGTYYIRRDGDGAVHKFISLNTLKGFFPPPMIAFLGGLFLILTENRLPVFLLETCRYLGNMTTPLAMLFIGGAIHAIDSKQLTLSKDLLAIFAGRFAFSPAIVFLLSLVLPMPVLMKKVFVIQAAMPIMTQTAIVAAAYGADARYAAVLITATTLLSLAVIPFYMVIL